MTTITIPDIRKEVTVHASQETCFNVFTGKFNLWWPHEFHVGKTPPTEFILEPGKHGRWYSKHEDGKDVKIGYVDVWQPCDRLVLIWQLGGDFCFHEDIKSEIELQFIPLNESSTLVKMTHRNLDQLGGGAKNISERDGGCKEKIMLSYKNTTEHIK